MKMDTPGESVKLYSIHKLFLISTIKYITLINLICVDLTFKNVVFDLVFFMIASLG